jgi:PKD repeat protein
MFSLGPAMFNSIFRFVAFFVLLIGFAPIALAQLTLIPTYHSIGVYWKPVVSDPAPRARVTYWKNGESPQEGLDLWFDERFDEPPGINHNTFHTTFPDEAKRQYRGSLVHLEPGTVYNVKVELMDGSGVSAQTTTETWIDSANLEIANTVRLPSQAITRLVIKRGAGSAPTTSIAGSEVTITVPQSPPTPDPAKPWKGPYTLILPAADSTGADIDRTGLLGSGDDYDGQEPQSCVVIEKGVKRVIIRGLKLESCTRNGYVFWFTDYNEDFLTRDVIIEDSLVTNWGWTGLKEADTPDGDAAVACAFNSAPLTPVNLKPERIVVQRNRFYDPRYNSTHWAQVATDATHPKGPQGILFTQCGDNHVFRYNEIVGTVDGEAVQFTAGSPGSVSWKWHRLPANAPVTFSGSLPGGISANTIYYVKNPSADTFQVATTPAGAPVDISSNGSGTGRQAVTFSSGSQNISWPSHRLAVGTPVIFATSGTLPGGLNPGQKYFVVGNPTQDSFQVSATRGGSAIAMSGTGSGTHTATRKRFLMDGIGGNENFSWDAGWIFGDTDIYQNAITHVYDDGIEAEGANRNVRIWGNYFDRVFIPFGNASVGLGPLYVWRNVSHSTAGYMHMYDQDFKLRLPPYDQYSYTPKPDTENPRPFIKGGGNSDRPRGGRAYYFHNTTLQPLSAYCGATSNSCGVRTAIDDDGDSRELTNVHSFNNIWHTATRNSDGGPKHSAAVISDCTASNCRFVKDLHNVTTLAPGATGINGKPTYAASSGNHPGSGALPSAPNWQADFQLAAGSPGKGAAEPLKQFNGGAGSDVGANPAGTTMKFGRPASGVTPPMAVLNTNPSPATSDTGSLNVTFTSSSTQGSAPFTSITLNFGDGSPVLDWSDHPAPRMHNYGVGNFTATLTVTTSAGSDTDSKPVSVTTTPPSCQQPPTASFTATPQSGNAPLPVAFDASASSAVSPATITSYSMTYGAGQGGGSGVNQSHTYQSADSYTATLTVTDSNNCQSQPTSHTITVNPPTGGGSETVTLRNDLNGYTGTTDAQLWSGQPNTNRDLVMSIRTENDGASCTWCDSGVIRFAIFQSEGGLVPDGATIISATLKMYQFSGPPAMMKASRLLKNWHEQQVTWNIAATGTPWTVAGANGSGSDYLATADGQGQSPDADALNCDGPPADPNQCWMSIDVTSGVRAFGSGSANHGWKIAQVSSPIAGNYKNFNTSENGGFPQYRPQLVVVYTTTPPTSVTLMEDQGGYAGSTDAHLWSGQPNTNRDLVLSIRTESEPSCTWCDSGVIRFPIFVSEGGPVPNGATITSATLSLYQFSGPDAVIKASRLLKSWHEQQVTWNVAATGTPWTVAGANGSGTDYLASADGQAQGPNADALNCDGPPADPNVCWLNIDVTSGVQAFATGSANYGWKIAQVSSSVPGNYKNFNTSENTFFPAFRPKLTVQYVVP